MSILSNLCVGGQVVGETLLLNEQTRPGWILIAIGPELGGW